MKLNLFLLSVLFSLPLAAQKPFRIKLTESVESRHNLPYRISAVKDLTQNDGILGIVHTSLINVPKNAVLDSGTEFAILRIAQPNDRDKVAKLPVATLNLLRFSLSETILMSKEIGKVEMAATLTVETPEGLKHYGPASQTLSKGGISDVTQTHDDRITTALNELLIELGQAYLAGNEIESDTPQYHPLDTSITDGVYRSEFDFLLSRTNEDIALTPTGSEFIGEVDDVPFFRKELTRPKGVKRKQLDRIYGYHHAGKSYLLVKNRFYSVDRLDDGRIAALLPKDLNLIMKLGAEEIVGYAIGGILGGVIAATGEDDSNDLILYELDTKTGKFIPSAGSYTVEKTPAKVVAMSLINMSQEGAAPIEVNLGEEVVRLRPGAGVKMDVETIIRYQNGQKETKQALRLFAADRNEEVYVLERKSNGKVYFGWVPVNQREERLKDIEWVEIDNQKHLHGWASIFAAPPPAFCSPGPL